MKRRSPRAASRPPPPPTVSSRTVTLRDSQDAGISETCGGAAPHPLGSRIHHAIGSFPPFPFSRGLLGTPAAALRLRCLSPTHSGASSDRLSTDTSIATRHEYGYGDSYASRSVSSTGYEVSLQISGSDLDSTTPCVNKPKRIRLKTDRRREQCRRNQARYRQKQQLASSELEATVKQLRADVTQLRAQHQSLFTSVNIREAVVRTMIEHFRLFRHGLSAVTAVTAAPRRRRPTLDEQLAYITSAIDEHVRIDDARGRAFFVEQLRRFSSLYDGLVLLLERYEMITAAEASTSLVVTIRLEMTITLMTIRYVFPHLLSSQHNELRWKIIGCRLACPSSGVLDFDARGQIVGIRWTVDLIASLRTVLTLEEVAIVVQDAHIARDAYLLEAGDEMVNTSESG